MIMEKVKKYQSSFSVSRILNNLSSSSDGESRDNAFAFKLALFNGLAIVVVFIIVVTTSSVYFILNPFVKPLLWALLCGSALHPFKQVLALKFKSILIAVETSEYSTFNFILWPFPVLVRSADFVGELIWSYKNLLIQCTVSIVSLIFIYFYIPFLPSLVTRLTSLWFIICSTSVITCLDIFSNLLIVGTVILAYFLCLILFWKPELTYLYSIGYSTVWIAVTSYFCGFFSYLRIPLFVLIQSFLFGSYFYSSFKNSNESGQEEKEKIPGEGDVDDKTKDADSGKETKPSKNIDNLSMKYIRCLAVVCALVVMFHLLYFLAVIPILLLVYIVKTVVIKFGIADAVHAQMLSLQVTLEMWYKERKEVILPVPVENSLKIVCDSWRSLIAFLKTSCDSAAAVAVILCLILFVVFGSIFLAVQAYREGVYLVQTGGSIINSTIVHNPELHHLLPEDWESTLDTALNNTYIYIRETLANMLKGLLKNKGISETRSVELEKNIIELWDRAYQAWVVPLQPNKLQEVQGPSVTAEAVRHSFEQFVEGLISTPEVASVSSIGQFIKDNMATLTSSLDSVWLILKGNMSLLLSLLSACFSLVFGGSLSLINFIFHMVVFLTALFYLLSTSREMYKPVELITGMSPKYGNKLAVAVEKACQGVLAASAKLSLFYGMWTWLIHTLFQCNLVYMPAVFAAILGVVPVLGAYWACVPAVLDLWLVQDRLVMALGLLIAQFLPTFIVDSTIYNEMRGGHPYITGLSVAGGIFWLGLEGAIIGPLILCFLFVIVNIITDFNQYDEVV